MNLRSVRNLGLAMSLMALISLGCQKADKPAEASEPEVGAVAVETLTVEMHPMRRILAVTGTFAASQGNAARLSFAQAGRIDKVFVREGDWVRRGQVLASLDLKVQESQRKVSDLAARAAQSQAEEAGIAFEASREENNASIRAAQISLHQAIAERDGTISQSEFELSTAKSELRRLENGARPQEVAQAHQIVVQSEVTRDRAKVELQRIQALADEGYVARRQLEDTRAALANAESALLSAQANESLVREGARPEDRQAARLKVAASEKALANAKLVGAQKVSLAEGVLSQAKKAALSVTAKQRDAAAFASIARQREAETTVAIATSAQGQLRAPYDGRIVRRLQNPGDFVDTSVPVLEISAGSNQVDFLAGVPASDAEQVRPGMAVELQIGKDHPLGDVLAVSNADVTSGLCTIRISTDAKAVAGTFSTAIVVLETIPSAVAVPKEAVLDRDGKPTVFVVNGETAKLAEIKKGAEDGEFVQVLSGVKAGDSVIKLGQFELSDGAKIKLIDPKAKEEEKSPETDKTEGKKG